MTVAGVGCNDDQQTAPTIVHVGTVAITKDDVKRAARSEREEVAHGRLSAEAARRRALRGLVQAAWIKQEAQRLAVPNASKETAADLLDAFHREAVRAERPLLKTSAVAYYKANKEQYRKPKSRFLDIVRTETRASAVAAKRALDNGRSWPEVVARYSRDPEARKARSGTTGLIEGEWTVPIGPAIFQAPLHQNVGPVQAEDGWAVFRVRSAYPGRQLSFAESREDVESFRLQARRHAIDVVNAGLIDRYKPATRCAPAIGLPECKDGPSMGPHLIADRTNLIIQGGTAYHSHG